MESKPTRTIRIISPFESYWGIFLCFNCNFHCDYCIQNIKSRVSPYKIVKGCDWAEALNNIENRTKRRFLRRDKPKKLAIIGGEPSLHPDFLYILNNIDYNYSITVTTNLNSEIFNKIDLFVKYLKRKRRLRLHVSYHPNDNNNLENFIDKIKFLKRSNINVNRIFMVAFPPDDVNLIHEHKDIFKKNKLDLEIQRFMGFYNEKLYPLADKKNSNYDFEDNINDYNLYIKACSLKDKKTVLCKIFKVLFAPDGTIYNCHYKLYNKSNDNYGNLFKESIINPPQEYFSCDSFGLCNPCDFGQTSIKEI